MSEQAPRTEAIQPSHAKELMVGAVLGAAGAGAALGMRALSAQLKYKTVGSGAIPPGDIPPQHRLDSAVHETHGDSFESTRPELKARARQLGKNALDKLTTAAEQGILLIDTVSTLRSGVKKWRRHAKQNENKSQLISTDTVTTVPPLQKYL